jgi:predicted Zn finger-like uncharacterized protein
MHIRCERCQAEYELDDSQVRAGRAEVQCSVCANVFSVAQPQGASDISPSPDTWLQDRTEGNAHVSRRKTHGALKLFVSLTVTAAVAVVGILWQEGRFHLATIAPKVARQASPTAGGLGQPANLADSQARGEAQIPGQAVPAGPSTNRPLVEALPSPPPAEAPTPSPAPAKPAAAPAESYEKLVADADRLLTGGSNTKAKELYQRALRVRPGGFKAICGLGFVALDLGQIPVAYEYFKRALAAKKSYPPALFGLAEIHRARGEKTLALQSYKHYLQIMPNGSDAKAARRQLEALQASR